SRSMFTGGSSLSSSSSQAALGSRAKSSSGNVNRGKFRPFIIIPLLCFSRLGRAAPDLLSNLPAGELTRVIPLTKIGEEGSGAASGANDVGGGASGGDSVLCHRERLCADGAGVGVCGWRPCLALPGSAGASARGHHGGVSRGESGA